MGISESMGHMTTSTLKPRYNDHFNNKIPAIKNLILSPFIVNLIVKQGGYSKPQARSNCHVTSFRTKQILQNFIGPTDR
jgi:hypothetical protein